MNKVVSKIRSSFLNNIKFKHVLYYSILTFLFLYVFSIPAFANRVGYNLICYGLVAGLIALTIVYILIFGLAKSFDKRTLIIIAFVISSLVGTLSYSHEYRGLLTLVLLTISFFVIYLASLIINNNQLIFIGFVGAFFTFAIYFVIVYRADILNFSSFKYDEFRLGWYFENPNTIGSFMTLAISISTYLVVFKKKLIRFIFIIPTLLFLLVGLTTGSRTFLISLLLLVVLFVLFKLKNHIIIALLIIASIVAVSIILINTVPILSTIKYRLIDTFDMLINGVSSGSTLERILWQRYGFYLSSRRIFFGFGESGFAKASGVGTYTHGNFTEVLCDFGLVGFVLFYYFSAAPIVISALSKKEDKEYLITILVVYLINGFLSVYYYDKCTYVIMALCFCLLDNAKPSLSLTQKSLKKNYCEVLI